MCHKRALESVQLLAVFKDGHTDWVGVYHFVSSSGAGNAIHPLLVQWLNDREAELWDEETEKSARKDRYRLFLLAARDADFPYKSNA